MVDHFKHNVTGECFNVEKDQLPIDITIHDNLEQFKAHILIVGNKIRLHTELKDGSRQNAKTKMNDKKTDVVDRAAAEVKKSTVQPSAATITAYNRMRKAPDDTPS